jgi:hypothetical protein
MKTIHGTYRTTHWQEHEYSPSPQGPRLLVAERDATIGGGIQGKGVLRYSIVQLTNGSSRFTGHQRITGRLGDREGSFVVEESSTSNGAGASGTWTIVADSASGDLAGLKGEGTWTWEKGSHEVSYTLSYEL